MEIRSTRAIIDRAAVKSNYIQLKRNLAGGVKTLAVVKANAYGHGVVEITKTLERAGCNCFGVAICEEGVELRKAGIKSPIILLGGISADQIGAVVRYNLTPVVFDIKTAQLLNGFLKKRNKRLKIHVKIDTGMGRLGVLPHQVGPFFKQLKKLKNLNAEGILSHFAEADEENKGFSRKQLGVFAEAINTIRKMGFRPELVHIANSAAVVDYRDSHFNLVRPGIMLYGAYPARWMEAKIRLKPAMRLVTRVIQIKKVPVGSPLSYNRKFITRRKSVIAVVPIGYGDGYPRHLSNKGEVLVRGQRAKVVGIVCMDMTLVDVTDIRGVKEGDEVVIIGRQRNNGITVNEVAEKAGTIPYEIFCGISSRVPRVYI